MFFQKQTPIWNLAKTDNMTNSVTSNTETNSTKEIALKEKPDIHFYLEGGYLVNRIPSKVGIKISSTSDKKTTNVSFYTSDSRSNYTIKMKMLQTQEFQYTTFLLLKLINLAHKTKPSNVNYWVLKLTN